MSEKNTAKINYTKARANLNNNPTYENLQAYNEALEEYKKIDNRRNTLQHVPKHEREVIIKELKEKHAEGVSYYQLSYDYNIPYYSVLYYCTDRLAKARKYYKKKCELQQEQTVQ